MNADLYPSIWRTLRVLANPTRLRVLQTLQRESPLPVSRIARRHRLSMSSATQVLRALQARGLLRANRRGAWVFYAAEPNASVPYASVLAEALKRALALAGNDMVPVIAALTAYTNERRLGIVRALAAGTATRAGLGATCHVCHQSLGRHLDKLVRRGVIEERDGHIRMLPPQSHFQATLLVLALEKNEPPA